MWELHTPSNGLQQKLEISAGVIGHLVLYADWKTRKMRRVKSQTNFTKFIDLDGEKTDIYTYIYMLYR